MESSPGDDHRLGPRRKVPRHAALRMGKAARTRRSESDRKAALGWPRGGRNVSSVPGMKCAPSSRRPKVKKARSARTDSWEEGFTAIGRQPQIRSWRRSGNRLLESLPPAGGLRSAAFVEGRGSRTKALAHGRAFVGTGSSRNLAAIAPFGHRRDRPILAPVRDPARLIKDADLSGRRASFLNGGKDILPPLDIFQGT